MLSKFVSCNNVKKIINEILIDRYFTQITVTIINDFFDNITNIIYNKEQFTRDILDNFNDYNIEENEIYDYLNLATKAIRFTEKNYIQLEREIFKEKGLKIKRIKVLLDNEKVNLIFTNNSRVIFIDDSALKKYSLFNEVIYYLNKKTTKENNLQSRKFISSGKYALLEASELIKDRELFKYYFKSGELLTVLYLLCCKDIEELFSLGDSITDNNFSANNIAYHILKYSVYNINFLHSDKMNLTNSNCRAVKSGFEYMYNIIIRNKAEFIAFIKNRFSNNIEYLGNILNKINILNEEDLKMQLYLIDVRFLKNESFIQHIDLLEDEGSGRVDKKRFVELVDRLGDHLIKKSIIGYSKGKTGRTWIEAILSDYYKKSEISYDVYDLYNGNSGIALFFVYLGELTQKKYFINTALEIMQESIEGMDNIRRYSKTMFYELFVLSKIYSITKSKIIESAINNGILSLYKIFKEDNNNHISAKDISIILSIYNTIECNKTKKSIINLGSILYENLNFENKCEEVLDFLIMFMKITKDKNIESTIDKLLNFERKKSSNRNYFEILLNRLKLKKIQYNDNLLNEEINEALNYIIKNEFHNNNYSYNEVIINLEILEYAAEVLGHESLKSRCINTYNSIVNKIIEPAIYEEISHGNMPISLMKGISGYGYSLIRKCSDKKLPILFHEGIVHIDNERY